MKHEVFCEGVRLSQARRGADVRLFQIVNVLGEPAEGLLMVMPKGGSAGYLFYDCSKWTQIIGKTPSPSDVNTYVWWFALLPKEEELERLAATITTRIKPIGDNDFDPDDCYLEDYF